MKYLLLLIFATILAALTYTYFFADDLPADFVAKRTQQQNPFIVPKDSAAIMWRRAKDFLWERRRLIVGGELRQNDSLLYIPYQNDYLRGNSIRIEKQAMGDSIKFTCHWWYSQSEQENGAKEIALYMQTGMSRYDKK